MVSIPLRAFLALLTIKGIYTKEEAHTIDDNLKGEKVPETLTECIEQMTKALNKSTK